MRTLHSSLPWLHRTHMRPARRVRDNLLDRYYPNLTPEERDLAHERMRNFGRMLGYVRAYTVKQGEHGS